MRIEILLKQIREKRRTEFGTIIKNDRNIKFAFKLYREKWENAYIDYFSYDCTSIKYKNRRII